MSAVITGIGWVGNNSMGCGKDHDAVLMERGNLPKITRKDVLDQPSKTFGRMDNFSKIGLAGISFALKDANLKNWSEKRDIGLIATSYLGCLETDSKYFESVLVDDGLLSSPGLFAYTLPNCFLGEAAIYFGLTGESYVLSEHPSRNKNCLMIALDNLNFGYNEIMICGCCDVEPPESLNLDLNVIPGSLFFVIEKKCTNNKYIYGKLSLDNKNNLCVDDSEFKNLFDLAKKCMF